MNAKILNFPAREEIKQRAEWQEEALLTFLDALAAARETVPFLGKEHLRLARVNLQILENKLSLRQHSN